MKILLDPHIFNIQKFGGISRYYSEILNIIKSKKESSILCPIHYTDNFHIINYDLNSNRILNNFNNKFSRSIKKKLLKKNYTATIEILKKGKVDIFIPSYYDLYFLDYLKNIPFVLTVYDMIHEIYPERLDENEKIVIKNKQILLEKANKIIAISQNTKQDILKFYPHIPEEKIEVVYLSQSISKDFYDSGHIQKVIGDKNSYILFVGNRGGYKNFDWFIKSVASWLAKSNMKLLCLGGGKFSMEEEQLMEDLNVKDMVVQYTFQDHELYGFYNNALAFIFPSQYEGFGIPVLESMAAGCPVVLPKISSFPEVAEEAGLYFSLSEKDSLINVLDKVLKDEPFRKDVINQGYAQAKKFSWEKTIDDCLKVYKKVVSSSV